MSLISDSLGILMSAISRLQMNRRRIAKWFLFLIAFVLAISGFLVSNAENISWVMAILDAEYIRGIRGLELLESELELKRGDQGFEVIVELYRNIAPLTAAGKAKYNTGNLTVLRVERPRNLKLSPSGFNLRKPVVFTFANGNKIECSIESLEVELDKQKRKNLFEYGAALFATGLLFMIIDFRIG